MKKNYTVIISSRADFFFFAALYIATGCAFLFVKKALLFEAVDDEGLSKKLTIF